MRVLKHTVAAFAAFGIAVATTQAAEVELRAVSGLPAQNIVTQVFLNWVKGVNERGKGIVQIKYLGANEITPIFQQAAAVKRGLFDVLHTPAAFYAGQNKHVDALLASNVPMETMRKNGAMKILEELWLQQMGVHVMGWFDTHVEFSLFLGKDVKFNQPKTPADLKRMLSGLKMWSTPTFREFLIALGATPVALPPTEILPALDKGLVQGYGFPVYGLLGFGLERASKTYFLPTYYRGNTMAMININKWKSLPQNVKDFLTKEGLAYETASKSFIEAGVKKEMDILAKNGGKSVKLPDDIGKAYRRLAHEIAWERLAKRAPKETPALRKLMYDPNLD